MRAILTPARLSEYGRALYGPRWKVVLAFHLGVTRETVANWARGRTKPSGDVRERISDLLADHIAVLCELKADLDGI